MAPGTYTSYKPISLPPLQVSGFLNLQKLPALHLNRPFTSFQPLWSSSFQLPPIGSANSTLELYKEDVQAINVESREEKAIESLKKMSPSDLHNLGKKLDKTEFFEALLPAALESQKLYGVPAEVTLVQAAIESDWGRKGIGGYNIFGIKGSGDAGSIKTNTTEFIDGKPVKMKLGFARYSNFYEAVSAHGKLFHNRYFKQITEDYQADGNKPRFIQRMAKRYATAPNYAWAINRRIKLYDLENLVQKATVQSQA